MRSPILLVLRNDIHKLSQLLLRTNSFGSLALCGMKKSNKPLRFKIFQCDLHLISVTINNKIPAISIYLTNDQPPVFLQRNSHKTALNDRMLLEKFQNESFDNSPLDC